MHPLLRQACTGQNEARAQLHDRHAAELERFVNGLMGWRLRRFTSVEEICQETFLQVFRGLGSLPEDADLQTFRGRLFQNARWLVQQAAARSRSFAGESDASKEEALAADEPRTGAVTRQDQVDWLHRLIDLLRPSYAEIIRLRLSGLEFREIARRLETKEDTIRRRYSRAYHALEELLAQRQGPPES